MHALLVSDIVYAIVQFLDPHTDRSSLLSLATTNRLFSEHALNHLWRVIYNFDGIIGCLPKRIRAKCVNGRYPGAVVVSATASAPSAEADWVGSRFKQYACRVRALILNRPFQYGKPRKFMRGVNIPTLRALVQYGYNFGPIFSNLVHLSFRLQQSSEADPIIAKIVQQHTTHELFILHLDIPRSLVSDVRSWITTVHALGGSSITELQLSLGVNDDESRNDLDIACTKAISRLPSLRSLHLDYPLRPSTEVASISKLSNLSSLSLDKATLDTSPLHGTRGFPALQDFSITVKSLSDLYVFISAICSASLKVINCRYEKVVQANELQKIIGSVTQHNSRAQISAIVTWSIGAYEKNKEFQSLDFMETYGPLKALPDLTQFSIPNTFVRAPTDKEFMTFVTSLPKLFSFAGAQVIPVSLPTFRLALRRFSNTDRTLPVILRPDLCLLNCDSPTTSKRMWVTFANVPEDPSIQELARGLLTQFPNAGSFAYCEDVADDTEEARKRGKALALSVERLRRDARQSYDEESECDLQMGLFD